METQILAQIEERIILSGRDSRYSLGAYGFTLASLDYQRSKSEKLDHIPAYKLVDSACELAVLKFGPLAKPVFSQWGILEPVDIGNIVYNLIDIEILSKSSDDSLDDFVLLEPLFKKMRPEESFEVESNKIKSFIDS